MKYTKLFILSVAICFSVATVKAQVSSADSMIHKIFATLKAKDEKAFVSLYPNGKQLQNFVRTIMEASMKTEQMQQMQKMQNINLDSLVNAQLESLSKPEVMEQMQKSFGRSFQQVIEKGEKKGVNWSNAKLTTYTFDTTVAVNDQEEAMMSELGYKTLKGVMDFTSGDSAYQMSFNKVMYIPAEGGWFGGEFNQVVRKGEGFKTDTEMETTDVNVSTEKEAPVPPPPPAKPKTKVKTKTTTPATKTKTKTKS